MQTQEHTCAGTGKPAPARGQTLAPRPGAERPVFEPIPLHVEQAHRQRAIDSGGISLIHTLVHELGLPSAINQRLTLLKAHLPYFESDHVLALVYNVLTGGTCLQDLDALRTDPAFLALIGAERLPDPTTAGDFLRRFDAPALLELQEAINQVRVRVWTTQPALLRREAIIDADGTIAATLGEAKKGIDISYKGIWGYSPLLLTLASTKEVLYVVNRPGNANSCLGAGEWIDRAIALVAPHFGRVWLRGDTDFSMTAHLDGWDQEGVRFVLGYDAYDVLIARAQQVPETAWYEWDRHERKAASTTQRKRPEAVKDAIVAARGYKTIRLVCEQVAEFDYQPTACRHPYRMVVVRKHLEITHKGSVTHETRYVFYITNDRIKAPHTIVRFANARCNQENIIAQLKSGLGALRCPTNTLESNWAYMISASLGWNLKAWVGILMGPTAVGAALLAMEIKRFLREVIFIPAQILHSGRRLKVRLLAGAHRVLEMLGRIRSVLGRCPV
jgi:hypothetical protein